ncbi:T9SS type A sorting domain-containing protein [uncultured Polaribacter sp.]|uniref:T9SS type A sorting domain-containing protein n=1 Tax=uncultured Polaribacter sp. TaxID=174711 RepID=UPI00262D1CA0|nr:T9SS type A sorting domain-containing protein [uncultured Polaribacter sp.]
MEKITEKIKLLALVIILTSSLVFQSQTISYSFANAQNTVEGSNTFYEVDVLLSTDTNFKLGAGQFYIDYNTAAFGEAIEGGNLTFSRPAGSVLAEKIFGGALDAYNIVNTNSTASKVSFSWSTAVAGQVSENVTVAGSPNLICHLKILYVDTNEAPNISFDTTTTPDFVTSFGLTFIDTTPIGTQLLNDNYDSSGSVITPLITWEGGSNSSITDASNWAGGNLPSITDNVTIPNVAISPRIDAGVTFQANDFTVNGLLNIREGGNLLVDGNFTNTRQVRMTSTATESATLLVKGTATGTITYERGGLIANEFSIVTAPVNGQSIKAFVENPTNDIRVNTSVTPNRLAIAFYDESQPVGSKWVYYTTDDIATDALTFEQGRAYAISRNTNGSVTFTGTLETENVTKNLDVEWNAIGNPYTTFLPVNENGNANFVSDNTSKLNPANLGVYVWDNTQGKYIVLPLSGPESFVAPGQGFFVRAAVGATEVSFDETQRMTQPASGGTFNKNTNNETETGITLITKAKGKSVKTVVNYSNKATEGLDPGYDLGNFAGAELDVYTKLLSDINGEDFTIQAVPLQNINSTSVPLGLVAEKDTELIFSIETKNLPFDTKVYLEDKVLNTITELDESEHIVNITNKINGSGRFFLNTQSAKEVLSIENNSLLAVKIYASKETLFIKGLEKGVFNLKLFNVIGKEVFAAKEIGNGANKIALPNLQTGIYIVKINSSLGSKISKIIIE